MGVSDQRLNQHLKPIKNIRPSIASTLAEMTRSVETFSRWLETTGYTGLVGFDFVEYVDQESGNIRYFLAEVNARMNGAAYPSFLLEHLNARQHAHRFPAIGAYLSTLISLRTASFMEFRHDMASYFSTREPDAG